MLLVARLVRLAAAIVVGLIAIGIVAHVLGANAHNGVVSALYSVDRTLVSPFRNLFAPHNAKVRIAVNWGVAAIVYALIAAVIVRLATAAGLGARRAARRRGTRVAWR